MLYSEDSNEKITSGIFLSTTRTIIRLKCIKMKQFLYVIQGSIVNDLKLQAIFVPIMAQFLHTQSVLLVTDLSTLY
jgi:hypothetical protein